jgi:hypothetical protein
MSEIRMFLRANTPCADFKTSVVYDLPFGNGKAFLAHSNGAVNAAVGGWQLVFYLERASGNALAITASNNLSQFGYATKRGSVVGGVPVTLNTDTSNFNPATDHFINPAAFTAPATYSLGNTGRTLDWLRGPGFSTESASIRKMFRIYERINMKLAGEFQNPFNFVRWANPVTNLATSNFGMITSSSPGRRVQLNLEIQF